MGLPGNGGEFGVLDPRQVMKLFLTMTSFDRSYTCWRFVIRAPLGPYEMKVKYNVNNGPAASGPRPEAKYEMGNPVAMQPPVVDIVDDCCGGISESEDLEGETASAGYGRATAHAIENGVWIRRWSVSWFAQFPHTLTRFLCEALDTDSCNGPRPTPRFYYDRSHSLRRNSARAPKSSGVLE